MWPEFGSTTAYVKLAPDGTVVVVKDLRGSSCKAFRDVLAAQLKQE